MDQRNPKTSEIIERNIIYGKLVILYKNKIVKANRHKLLNEYAHEVIVCNVSAISIINIVKKIDEKVRIYILKETKAMYPSSSYSSIEKRIYIHRPDKDSEMFLLHTIFHEIGHLYLGHCDKRNDVDEKAAWDFSKNETEKLFGKLSSEYFCLLEKHINGCMLKTENIFS